MEAFSWGLVLCIDIVDMSNKCSSHQAFFFTNSFTALFNLCSFNASLIFMFRHGGGGGEAGSVGWWGAEEEDEYEEDGGSRHGCSSGDRDMEREIYRNQFV